MTKKDWGRFFDKVRERLGLGGDNETATLAPAVAPDRGSAPRPESNPTPTPGVVKEDSQ
ncbi:hypothetical protein KKA13_04485 [Patescibacteria group bacterium]|nr:hypothetical protein [Patescibacteria group bacterium]MBU1613233.1 hypothetical protein [Patescibacteria group bacterium]